MKKDSTHRRTIPSEDALERYDCDKAMRGRHAYSYPKGAHAVVIAPELYHPRGQAISLMHRTTSAVHQYPE